MKKIILVIVLNVALTGVQLAVAVGRSADGVSVTTADTKLNQLREENSRLAETLYTKSSLLYVASQAGQLGLASGQVRWVGGQASVAKAP